MNGFNGERSIGIEKLARMPVRGPGPTSNRPLIPSQHEWQKIRLGRVCGICMVAQVSGEFDDRVPCQLRQAS